MNHCGALPVPRLRTDNFVTVYTKTTQRPVQTRQPVGVIALPLYATNNDRLSWLIQYSNDEPVTGKSKMTNAIATRKPEAIQVIETEIIESDPTTPQSEFTNKDKLIAAWLGEKSESTRKTYIKAVKQFLAFGGAIAP